MGKTERRVNGLKKLEIPFGRKSNCPLWRESSHRTSCSLCANLNQQRFFWLIIGNSMLGANGIPKTNIFSRGGSITPSARPSMVSRLSCPSDTGGACLSRPIMDLTSRFLHCPSDLTSRSLQGLFHSVTVLPIKEVNDEIWRSFPSFGNKLGINVVTF